MADQLVTGASSGVGAELCRELVRRGHRIWGVARRAELLQDLQVELGADRFVYSSCDVGSARDIDAALGAMRATGFSPTVVYLNAGINPEIDGRGFHLDDLEAVIRVNLHGSLVWVDRLLPGFLETRSGQFVAISSLAALRGDARWVAYAASKAALTRAFESLRGRHAAQGVAFTTIHLGAVTTGLGAASRSPWRLAPRTAAGRIVDAAERRVGTASIPRLPRVLQSLLAVLPDPVFSRLVMRAFGRGGPRGRRADGQVVDAGSERAVGETGGLG